jgi:hypothetical protein
VLDAGAILISVTLVLPTAAHGGGDEMELERGDEGTLRALVTRGEMGSWGGSIPRCAVLDVRTLRTIFIGCGDIRRCAPNASTPYPQRRNHTLNDTDDGARHSTS